MPGNAKSSAYRAATGRLEDQTCILELVLGSRFIHCTASEGCWTPARQETRLLKYLGVIMKGTGRVRFDAW